LLFGELIYNYHELKILIDVKAKTVNMSDVEIHNTHFLDAPDQYLVVIGSCLPQKIDQKKEPILYEVAQRFSYVNVYGQKREPGTYQVVGDGHVNRNIIMVFSQFYSGRKDYPNDSKQQRLNRFADALNEIAELDGLVSLAFPSQVARDGGGNWSQYFQLINDFASAVHLNNPTIKINIYDNPVQAVQTETVQTQISLLNCINLLDHIPIENLYIAAGDNKIEVSPHNPTFNMSKGERTTMKMNFKNLTQSANLDDETETDDTTAPVGPPAPPKPSSFSFKVDTGELKRYYPETLRNSDWKYSMIDKLQELVDPSWMELFGRKETKQLLKVVEEELFKDLEANGNKARFLPEFNNIFNAFRLCPLDKLKVVILGQDPYFSNLDEAMGLSFSVPKGVMVPPSLKNIFKEISNCYGDDYSIPSHGDLTRWAEQGVLLLNSSLSVKHKEKACHMKVWHVFTDRMIELISNCNKTPVIFMLWGGFAQKKSKLINARKHMVLKATHPSPLGANKGGWFGCKHFLHCNEKLQSSGLEKIDWQT
jgi:uracil-DNA glycosylase